MKDSANSSWKCAGAGHWSVRSLCHNWALLDKPSENKPNFPIDTTKQGKKYWID